MPDNSEDHAQSRLAWNQSAEFWSREFPPASPPPSKMMNERVCVPLSDTPYDRLPVPSAPVGWYPTSVPSM